jgi:hypothetical protein
VRFQDEFAAMIVEVFPEAHHLIRHAARRHWRDKLKPYSKMTVENVSRVDNHWTENANSQPAK